MWPLAGLLLQSINPGVGDLKLASSLPAKASLPLGVLGGSTHCTGCTALLWCVEELQSKRTNIFQLFLCQMCVRHKKDVDLVDVNSAGDLPSSQGMGNAWPSQDRERPSAVLHPEKQTHRQRERGRTERQRERGREGRQTVSFRPDQAHSSNIHQQLSSYVHIVSKYNQLSKGNLFIVLILYTVQTECSCNIRTGMPPRRRLS